MNNFFTGKGKLKVALQMVILFCAGCCNGQTQELKFTDLLDSPKIMSVQLSANFAEAALSIEGVLASNLSHIDRPGMLPFATKLRVLLATLREGEKPVSRKETSIRGLLQEFATKWKIAVLLGDDVIMIVEPVDVNRFQHQLAIIPEKE